MYVGLSRGYDFNGGVTASPLGSASNDEVGRVGDVDGDGRDDAVLFATDGSGDVHVMLSNGSVLGPRTRWHDFFALEGETPMLGDVDADGRADLIDFTQGMWGSQGDINGDGRDDLIGFTQDQAADVWVAMSQGSQFGAPYVAHDYFAP